MAYVYKYTDLLDNVVKYVGIVWGKTRTLQDRIKEHSLNDDWCKKRAWKIEYIETPINTRTDAEYMEAHYISLYHTDEWFNIKKAGWGVSSFIKNEDNWKKYNQDKYKETLQQIKIKQLNKDIKDKESYIYSLDEKINKLEEKLKETRINSNKIENINRVKKEDIIYNKISYIEPKSEKEHRFTVDEIIAIYEYSNDNDLFFSSCIFNENNICTNTSKIYLEDNEIKFTSDYLKNILIANSKSENTSDNIFDNKLAFNAFDNMYIFSLSVINKWVASNSKAYKYLIQLLKDKINEINVKLNKYENEKYSLEYIFKEDKYNSWYISDDEKIEICNHNFVEKDRYRIIDKILNIDKLVDKEFLKRYNNHKFYINVSERRKLINKKRDILSKYENILKENK